VIRTVPADVRTGSREIPARMRSAARSASRPPEAGSTIMNSSPPNRSIES
jgi:hypothetical protein